MTGHDGFVDIRAELARAGDPWRLRKLGFRPADAVGVERLLRCVGDDPQLLGMVSRATAELGQRIGNLVDHGKFAETGDQHTVQQIALLALLASVDRVREFHRVRGVDADISWQTLADLGQQVAVHRETFGEFGLHTHNWLRTAWSGGLFWLGRLQFELVRRDGRWYLSVHIPATTALSPASVDAALAKAYAFFEEHFGELAPVGFHCSSWLLDPRLGEVLPAESNIVQFQRRWDLVGQGQPGDADAIFFVFQRRDRPPVDTLPRRTSLQRAIGDHLRAGGHWQVRDGTIS